MTDRDRGDVLEKLGVSAADLGESEHLTWPEPPVGQAKGFAPVVALAALLSGDGPATVSVSLGLLDRLGIQARALASEPRLIKFSSADPGEAIHVRLAQPTPEAVAQAAEHPDVIAVDTARSGAFLLTVGQGQVLLIPAERGIEVHPVFAPPDLPPFDAVSAPLLHWVADCGDPWLGTEVEALAVAGDTWSVAVAAGMYARLVEPASTALARDRVEATLRGEVDLQLARPRVWARSLNANQLSTLERLALAEIDRLHEQLDAVVGAAEASDADWQSDWIRVCSAREGIEGVALLLGEAGHLSNVRGALDVLDREGRRTRLGIPLQGLPPDERLRRATLRDPFCWWGGVL